MLRELKIENLAIIDELDLEFKEGFAVLTGETGAGKSIILNAINLLIGEKASVDMIRDGEESLLAQGVFDINNEQAIVLEKYGIDIDEREVIVRRYFSRSGKAKVFVNNVRVTLNDLKEIMSNLVDIVGQHSHQMLLNKGNHILLLDSFLTKEDKILKNNIEEIVKEYKYLKEKINEIEIERKETLEKKEFYEFQLDEIEKLKLTEEDETIEADYNRAFNSEKIREQLSEVLDDLKNSEFSALDILHTSQKNLEYLNKYDSLYIKFSERIANIYYELEDCVEQIEDIASNIDIDEYELNRIAKRMDQLKKAKSKYKRDLKELITYREQLREKINLLEKGDFEIENLRKELEKVEKKYYLFADKLSNKRKEISKKIERELLEELKFLNMENTRLKISFSKENKILNNGYDDIEFLISTNLGQSLKPLYKIASGGEVSRVMLALKVIFSKVDNIPILIFDEIDTGVGGETVRKIALKLKEIGDNTQIISITHSPVIAAKANQQFFIEKCVENNRTISKVKKLSSEERVKEIGRMLVGENISKDVLEIAEKMLNEVV